MPKSLDDCVKSLLAKWKANPKARPTPKKDKKGKPQDASQQAHAICTASLQKAGKMEEGYSVYLEWANPVITGMALTNRPHIKGLEPVSFVEEEGERVLKMPLLLLGKWKHHTGILDFTQDVVAKMRQSFQDFALGHDLSVDNRHKPDEGAMGWIKRFGLETRADGKKQFSAYAKATPQGEKTVEEKRYRYASIEFNPDWENPLIAALSSDELELYVEDEEVTMPNETVVDGAGDEQVVALEALETELKKAQDALKLEQEGRTALQDRIVRLEQQSLRQFVDNILLKAEQYRDGENRAHSKVLLDWAKAVLLEEPIGEDENVIKLEDRTDATQTRAFYRRAIGRLLESLPGIVPMSSGETDPDKRKRLESDDYEPTDDEVKEFWGV